MAQNKYCLDEEYLIQLLNLIGVLATSRENQITISLKTLRRKFYAQKDWKAYQRIIDQEFRHQNKMQEQVT